MTIKLYSHFAKRKNSTRQQAEYYSTFTFENVVYKNGTSVLNPTVTLTGPYHKEPGAILGVYLAYCNYATISTIVDGSEYIRYYWIDDIIIQTNNTIDVVLSFDVLANYHNEIYNYTAFVEYAQNASSNPPYDDPRVLSSGYLRSGQNRVENALAGLNILSSADPYLTGTFIIKNVSASLSPYTACCGMYYTDYNNVINYMDYVTTPGTSLIDIVKKYIGNVSDATISISYLPVKNIYDEETAVPIEFMNTEVTNAKGIIQMPNPINSTNVHIEVPWVYEDWRDLRSTVTLYLPFVGYIDINVNDVWKCSYLDIDMRINKTTGKLIYEVDGIISATYRKPLGRYEANLWIDIPLGKVDTINPMMNIMTGAVSTIGSAVESIASAESIAGAAGSAVGGAINYAANTVKIGKVGMTTVNSHNSTVQYYDYRRDIEIYVATAETDDSYQSLYGKPVNMPIKLGDLYGGYIKCRDASISIAGFESVSDEINNYLNGGFYLE